MGNVVKSALKKSRDRLLSGITQSLNQLDSRVNVLQTGIQELKDNQLENNHHQTLVNEEIAKKIKNSGTIYLSEKEIVTKIFSGLKIFLDPKDLAVAPHLALDSIWEHRITAAWLAVIKPNDTILDIGSNFGYFGALAAQITDKKKSKVIHFEANPHLIPYIKKTMAINWLNEQSVVENLAAADKDGKLTLNVLKGYIGSSSIHSIKHLNKYMHNKMHLETESKISVDAVSIDSYCSQHDIKKVDLVKMDIEGFEDKAYLGMRKIVQSSPNITMFIEFTKESYDNPKQFYQQMLEDFGYAYVIDNDGYITKPKATSYEEIIEGADDWVMPIFSKNAKLANR